MIVQTETDLLPVLGYAEARQDDTDLIRLWEIAGTAHADASTLGPFASMVDCGVPINDGPQRFVLRAALRHLVAWAAGGEAPPEAPPAGDRPRARRRPLPPRPPTAWRAAASASPRSRCRWRRCRVTPARSTR